MKRSIEVDYEVMDKLVSQTLIDDYKNIRDDQKRLKNKMEMSDLHDYELEDYQNNKRYLEGFEKIFSYYLLPSELLNVINDEDDDEEYDDGRHPDGTPRDKIEELEERIQSLELALAIKNYNKNVDL